MPWQGALVRRLAFLFAFLPLAALADEVDLTPRSRRALRPPTLVLRAEGGTEFSPWGMAGGTLSYLTASKLELELGAGYGFPGLQLGFLTRYLFGDRGGYFVTELGVAGNTRINRLGDSNVDPVLNPGGRSKTSSVWSLLGLGFEQRQDWFSYGLGIDLVIGTDFSAHYAIHGGLGVALF